MEKSLELFLDEIEFPVDKRTGFIDADIEKVEYYETSKILLIHLNLVGVLDLDTYILFEDIIAKYPQNIKVIYSIKQAIYSADLVYEYFRYFINSYFINDNNSYLSKLSLEYQNYELKIGFANEGLALMFNPYKSKLESLMELAGFNIQYDYMVEENEEINAQIDEMIKAETTIQSKIVNVRQSNDIKQEQKRSITRFSKNNRDLKSYNVMQIKDLYDDYQDVCIEGYIFAQEIIKTRNGKHIQTIKITDFTDSIQLKRFEGYGLTKDDLEEIKAGMWVKALGNVQFDNYVKEHTMTLKSLQTIKPKIEDKYDLSNDKRVELHLHTNMSVMDGISPVGDYMKQALKYGHTALAITDHNNVQAYPDAYNNAISKDLKLIYGMESNLIDDNITIVDGSCDDTLNDATYVFFDLETTGLKAETDKIIEIGAIKYRNGLEIDRFQSFVNPGRQIPLLITNLTGISDNDVSNAPTIEEILPDFISFYDNSILVAHNASFDIGFIKTEIARQNLTKLENCVIDTLQLSRAVNKTSKAHNLGAIARKCKVSYNSEGAHRADYDAFVLAQVFEIMRQNLYVDYEIERISEINKLCNKDFLKRQRPFHCSILTKNQLGLKDLFKLVSKAHIDNFYDEPRLFKSDITEFREHLLIGSGCHNGEIYQNARSVDKNQLQEMMSFYDYIEVFPPENLIHLIDKGEFLNMEEIRNFTKDIIACAKELNKTVVACSDAHYVMEQQKEFREVYISALGIGGKIHPMFDRRNRITNIPDQHFKSTNEMLESFAFLGDELAYELVVTNTNKIADLIEEVKPIKDKLYTPRIAGVDQKLEQMCYDNAYQKYGNPLPKIVEDRLVKELNSITKHGFSVVYYISSQLVAKSLSDGYLVGSRGSVGSSLVATLSNITEVNPLLPHYYCPECSYSEFIEDGSYKSGYDLPDKECPHCQSKMIGDGQDIPFETFLGFEGDKVPDIDLNFSSEYQAIAHNYTKELFGDDHVFKAGTIQTVQAKTAYGYARGFYEKSRAQYDVRQTELERLAIGSEGVKRTTGQHPGGIIVIPDYMDVYDFTPINYPADDINSSWKTTHFDFHAIHDNVLKLDILGHVDPTAIRMLQDLTDIDPKTIPTNDAKVLSLFSSNDALGISDKVRYKNAAIGIPEFGTNFVRGMLEDTNPSSFTELVQISGLSHGTDVWLGNAQSLIERGICELKDVIGCRDDIMVYLMNKGLESKLAFNIMEFVRKGKGLKEEWIDVMEENNVPQWYIESCQKIKYMFPKAHAAAYVLMALRVAWFKVYYPLEYYATYFTTRCSVYDIETMSMGQEALEMKLSEYQVRDKENDLSAREKALIDVFEVALELYYRGYTISSVDIDKSLASKFSVNYDKKAIIPSFISIDGLGEAVAETVIKARAERPFISKEDLEKRTQLNKNHLLVLERSKSLSHLQELNQLSLF